MRTSTRAAFASNDPDDVVRWRDRGHADIARIISEQPLMVHEIVMAPEARQVGLGTQLLPQVVNDGREAEAAFATLASEDSAPALECFYASAGFITLPRGVQLELKFAASPRVIGFPQTQSHYRWAYRIMTPSRVRHFGPERIATSSLGVAANKRTHF